MRISKKGEDDSERLDVLLSEAITEDIVKWYKQWAGEHELGFEAKSDIYNVILQRFKKGVEI